MPTALVTGPVGERRSGISVALKSAGFDVVVAAPDAGPITGDAGSVDCFVQVPDEPPPRGDDALQWAREVVRQTLLERFDLIAHIAPLLAPRGKVVLVANEAEPRAPGVDAKLLRVLIMGILADHGHDGVRVAVVDGFRSPDEIARFISTEARSWREYADMAPHLGFADWRNEVFCAKSHPWDR